MNNKIKIILYSIALHYHEQFLNREYGESQELINDVLRLMEEKNEKHIYTGNGITPIEEFNNYLKMFIKYNGKKSIPNVKNVKETLIVKI